MVISCGGKCNCKSNHKEEDEHQDGADDLHLNGVGWLHLLISLSMPILSSLAGF